MAIFKCKMCGGSLDITEGMTVCECEYCGTQQTLPKAHDDAAANLFNRANNLRSKSEFDKAQALYEKLVTNYPEDSESYWGLVLCKYGIEYVEDPISLKKIPTCHRTQLEPVQTDADYLAALEHADTMQQSVYEREAAEIDRLQKDILAIVRNEKPFDVFICYKETDYDGKRTPDSVIANDIYYQLTQEGFKVFYAAITLEDKLGQAYEPYIYAALHSAKVMLVIGTKPEYFDAVWVRNEWSRYLKIVRQDRTKLLIPCYKDMDAYDLPEEFSHLQAQDMSKIGFINDVIRGIKKVLSSERTESKISKDTIVHRPTNTNIENFLKRGNIALEDGKWDEANRYFEQVLNENVEEPRAYIGKLCVELKIKRESDLINVRNDFTTSDYYKKACRFGGKEIEEKLNNYFKEGKYRIALEIYETGHVGRYNAVRKILKELGEYKDSVQLITEIDAKYTEAEYNELIKKLNETDNVHQIHSIKRKLINLGNYKDATLIVQECDEKEKEILFNEAYDIINKSSDSDEITEIISSLQQKYSDDKIDDLKIKAESKLDEIKKESELRREKSLLETLDRQEKDEKKQKARVIGVSAFLVIMILIIIISQM